MVCLLNIESESNTSHMFHNFLKSWFARIKPKQVHTPHMAGTPLDSGGIPHAMALTEGLPVGRHQRIPLPLEFPINLVVLCRGFDQTSLISLVLKIMPVNSVVINNLFFSIPHRGHCRGENEREVERKTRLADTRVAQEPRQQGWIPMNQQHRRQLTIQD